LAEVLKLVEYRDHTAATLFMAWRKYRRNSALDRRVPPLTVISKDDIRRLACVGCLPENADLEKFEREIRPTLATFRAIHETRSIDAKKQVRGLVDAVEAVDQAKRDATTQTKVDSAMARLHRAIGRLSPDLRRTLCAFDDESLDAIGPEGSPERWRARLVRALVTTPHAPRKTKKGRPKTVMRFQIYSYAPAKRGGPVAWAELWVTARIIDLWERYTGSRAPQLVNRAPHRRPHPAVAMLAEVLKLTGYRGHTATAMFNASRGPPCYLNHGGKFRVFV
jgi:hypothetical protein